MSDTAKESIGPTAIDAGQARASLADVNAVQETVLKVSESSWTADITLMSLAGAFAGLIAWGEPWSYWVGGVAAAAMVVFVAVQEKRSRWRQGIIQDGRAFARSFIYTMFGTAPIYLVVISGLRGHDQPWVSVAVALYVLVVGLFLIRSTRRYHDRRLAKGDFDRYTVQ